MPLIGCRRPPVDRRCSPQALCDSRIAGGGYRQWEAESDMAEDSTAIPGAVARTARMPASLPRVRRTYRARVGKRIGGRPAEVVTNEIRCAPPSRCSRSWGTQGRCHEVQAGLSVFEAALPEDGQALPRDPPPACRTPHRRCRRDRACCAGRPARLRIGATGSRSSTTTRRSRPRSDRSTRRCTGTAAPWLSKSSTPGGQGPHERPEPGVPDGRMFGGMVRRMDIGPGRRTAGAGGQALDYLKVAVATGLRGRLRRRSEFVIPHILAAAPLVLVGQRMGRRRGLSHASSPAAPGTAEDRCATLYQRLVLCRTGPRRRSLHADPHPGNYPRFTDDGKLSRCWTSARWPTCPTGCRRPHRTPASGSPCSAVPDGVLEGLHGRASSDQFIPGRASYRLPLAAGGTGTARDVSLRAVVRGEFMPCPTRKGC